MRKKIIAITAATLLLATVCGCGSQQEPDSTTYLHRYKKTEAYQVSDLQGVVLKKRTVTWKYSTLRSLPLKFKKAEDAQEFYNAVNSL